MGTSFTSRPRSEVALRGSMPGHGTRARYLRGCHCDECTEANAGYLAELRASDPKQRAEANGELTARMRRMAVSGATRCRCGGLLAENLAGVVYCLECGV